MVRKSLFSSWKDWLPITALVCLILIFCGGCTMVVGGGPFFRVEKHDSIVVVEVGAKIILQEVDGKKDDIATAKLWTEKIGRVEGAATDKSISAAR